MRSLATATAITITAVSPIFAENQHFMVQDFAEKPCTVIIDSIDKPEMVSPDLKGAVTGMGRMAMAFGFLLGFEAATGRDLSRGDQTVLMRLRDDCSNDPSMSALTILQSY